MTSIKTIFSRLTASAIALGLFAGAVQAETRPAKELFGAVQLPSKSAPAPLGFYSKGCQAGAVAIPADGPTWQAMRLSRNRRWGQPEMIALLQRLAIDAPALGWPGILIGDVSQPRGGPMPSGHASHQVGLDADIWLTPMPSPRLSEQAREDLPFTSMLQDNKFLTINPRNWTPAHARLIMKAASYPDVERIFVNPAIKKKLCDSWDGDRSALGKVRPVYGHDAHFHIRMSCPRGASGCKPQAPVTAGDGCDKSLAWWFTKEPWAPAKKDPNAKPAPKPKAMQLADLPKACTAVLNAPASAGAALAATSSPLSAAFTAPAADASGAWPQDLPSTIPVPRARPLD